jgi:hypothetical protein
MGTRWRLTGLRHRVFVSAIGPKPGNRDLTLKAISPRRAERDSGSASRRVTRRRTGLSGASPEVPASRKVIEWPIAMSGIHPIGKSLAGGGSVIRPRGSRQIKGSPFEDPPHSNNSFGTSVRSPTDCCRWSAALRDPRTALLPPFPFECMTGSFQR